MDHIEGSLRILRLSQETEPEPWTYEISFVPYAASSIPPACDVVGDNQLERALLYGLGLRAPHLDSSVQKARHDNVVIHHVHLTDDLKTLLITPDELARRSHEIPRHAEVVMYGAAGEAAGGRAALALRSAGIRRVRPLVGGVRGWRKRGFPVEPVGRLGRN
jgi:rhodanese-related sulfurtransferase